MKVGEGVMCEVVVYLFDYGGFVGVFATFFVNLTDGIEEDDGKFGLF